MLFQWKALDKDGNLRSGQMDGTEESQIVAKLKAQQLRPVQVKAGSASLNSSLPHRKPKAKDLSMLCEQSSSLLRAGVPVLNTLQLLAAQIKRPSLVEAINKTISGINEGQSLARSMEKTEVFDDTFVSLIAAGEASGSLDASLERLGNQYKKDAEIHAAISKAMIYPIFVILISIVVVAVMLLYIVPSFMKMFEDVGINMPKITLMVVGASNWLEENWLLALLIVIATIVAIVLFVKSQIGKKVISYCTLRIPGVKGFVIKTHASKIARTLSTLLTAGMPIIDALEILEKTLPNYYYKQSIHAIREDVMIGQPMSKKFTADPKLYPHMLSHMISVGEDTGDITAMLMKTADYYDLEVTTAIDSMMSMIQPMIILLIAGIVIVILAAVLAPMVTLYTELGDKL